ncbi:MAG: RrF2 family transcriptional regulator [Chloroflexota bacterium]|nr:Rrf2 family transcriptional regulator [Lentimicrobium sp.]
MSQIFPFSQATSIAFRSMVTITGSEVNLNIDMISDKTGASRHHVAKVLQRLAQTGLIGSKRGPGGGFFLKANPNSISLLDIYESIEGKWLLENTKGSKGKSLAPEPFDRLSDELSSHFITFLKSHTLSGYANENKS